MESHQRSQCRKRAPFPKEPPKGSSGGNQIYTYLVPDLKMAVKVGIPRGTKTLTLSICGKAKATGLWFIGVLRATRIGSQGGMDSIFDFMYVPKLKATAGDAGKIIMSRLFKTYFRQIKEQPEDQKKHLKALALDCAAIAKDPTLMGAVEVKSVDEWKAIKKAERLTRKVDDLDYLLANRYMAEGWNKLRMAEVGKICGKILKRKPFPASTIKDRTTALDLQTTLKPGAQAKTSSLKAVEKYLSRLK